MTSSSGEPVPPGISFNLKHPDAIEYMRNHGADSVDGISDEVHDALRAILVQAISEGWGGQRTAALIAEQIPELAADAPTIAHREVGQAYEAGKEMQSQGLADRGQPMEKRWVGGGGPCPQCAANMAAGWIPLNEPFPSGHAHPLAHDGCRCAGVHRVRPAGVN